MLSAVEGLTIASSAFKPWVVPLTCIILIGLFAIQRRGTGSVGRLFGPIMLLWFGTLAALGIGTSRIAPKSWALSRRTMPSTFSLAMVFTDS